ncbi:hypothetical protein N9X31_00275 [Candidatus Poseidoniales archaeon]|nr:hypothetical protein [Candidatus Poseidoniales archaeon]
MQRQALLILSCFLFALIIPSNPLIEQSAAEDVTVCCDSVEADLYLLSSGSDSILSPFEDLLAETPSSASFETALTSSEQIEKWVLSPAWSGVIPESTWSLELNYDVSDAGGAQLNLSAIVTIGGSTFTGYLDESTSFVAAGAGKITIDIPVESVTVSGTSEVSLTLNARTIVFSVPSSGASIEFLWGSEAEDSKVSANLPLLDLSLEEPVVEGDLVYFGLRIESPFGMEALVFSDSITMSVNGILLDGDPTEVSDGDAILVIWTWDGASGGVETVDVSMEYILQPGVKLTGLTMFEIETFDSNGGSGGYYPLNEPLRTSGRGSPLSITMNLELESEDNGIQLSRSTTLEIGGEMAFWMRWGMDHMGDESIPLSPVLKNFQAGAVSDDERGSRVIESLEVNQFEGYMGSYYITYFQLGLGIESEELLGDLSDSDTFAITLDLMGEDRVTNAPLTIRIDSLTPIQSGVDYTLVRSFIKSQPSPLWSGYDISISGSSSLMTSFSTVELDTSDVLEVDYLRFPWGEMVKIRGNGLTQSDEFSITTKPTSSPLAAPLSLSIIVVMILGGGLWLSFTMVRQKNRYPLLIETILIPIVFLMLFFAYPPLFVLLSSSGVAFAWLITAIASPKLTGIAYETPTRAPNIVTSFPTINCPQCGVANPVTSNERPIRLECNGCERIIKIVA